VRYKYNLQPAYLRAIIDFLEFKEGKSIEDLWAAVRAECANAPPLIETTFNYWVYNHIYVTIPGGDTHHLYPPGFDRGEVCYHPHISTQNFTRSRQLPISEVEIDIDIDDHTELIARLEAIVARSGYYFRNSIHGVHSS
jgi:hypothetical protein